MRREFVEMGVLMKNKKFGIKNTFIDDFFMRRTPSLITLDAEIKESC